MNKDINRTCLVTRESKPISELIRFTLLDGKLVIDLEHKLGGRGYYISKDKDIINEAKKKNLIKKALKVEASPSFYDDLLGLL